MCYQIYLCFICSHIILDHTRLKVKEFGFFELHYSQTNLHSSYFVFVCVLTAFPSMHLGQKGYCMELNSIANTSVMENRAVINAKMLLLLKDPRTVNNVYCIRVGDFHPLFFLQEDLLDRYDAEASQSTRAQL